MENVIRGASKTSIIATEANRNATKGEYQAYLQGVKI